MESESPPRSHAKVKEVSERLAKVGIRPEEKTPVEAELKKPWAALVMPPGRAFPGAFSAGFSRRRVRQTGFLWLQNYLEGIQVNRGLTRTKDMRGVLKKT